jgi:membrane protease subunit HflK
MSDDESKHDGHDHDHDHDHKHDHDHEHGHDHDSKPAAADKQVGDAAPAAPSERVIEDSGTRALSFALKRSFFFIKALVMVLAVGVVLSCIKQVEPGQQAVILRFGKVVRSADGATVRNPGFHWAWPYPIDEVVKIPVGESRTVRSSIGWPRLRDEDIYGVDEVARQEMISIPPGQHGYVLTSDHNIIHLRAMVKYRISDPVAYTFGFAEAAETLTNILDSAIIYASARFQADEALYKDQEFFKETIEGRVNQLIDRLELGVTLEPMSIERVPPLTTKSFFDEVQQSEQEQNNAINEARGYAQQTMRRALGDSNAVVSAAIGRSSELVQTVEAEAAYFKDQLPHFLENRELYTRRYLVENLRVALTNAERVVYMPANNGKEPRELRLQLSKEPQKLKTSF